MKSQIGKILITAILFMCYVPATALDIDETTPIEDVMLAAGYGSRAEVRSEHTAKTSAIAVEQAAITLMYERISSWEKQYSKYLETGSGYVSTLRAAVTIYVEAIQLFYSFQAVKGAMGDANAWFANGVNSGGAISTFLTTDLYLRVGQELVTIYQTLENAFKGGINNMLDGRERCKILWSLQDNMHKLNMDLRNIAYLTYTMTFIDAAQKLVGGRIEFTKKSIAEQCLTRWQKGAAALKNKGFYEHNVWLPDIVKDLIEVRQ